MYTFLNVIFDIKQKFSTVLPIVLDVLQEKNWENERVLFHFADVNDAETERRTVHAKLCKAFPQMVPYWKSGLEEHKRVHLNCDCYPHQFSYFSNFPSRVGGECVLKAVDKQINNNLILQISKKIPNPYSLYGAVIVLDGINWNTDNDQLPVWDWRYDLNEYDTKITDNQEQEYGMNMSYYPACSEYQNNSIILSKVFDTKPELELRIKLTPSHNQIEVERIVSVFAQHFGTPEKKYVTIVPSIKEKKEYCLNQNKMKEIYKKWRTQMEEELNCVVLQMKNDLEGMSETQRRKNVSRKTIQKHFLEKNGLKRHKIHRWDDHGWYKILPHNYWMYVEMYIQPKPQDTGYKNESWIEVVCYGMNFDLHDRIVINNFASQFGDVAAIITFEKFQRFFNKFEKEVIPKLAEIFGDTQSEFYQESYERTFHFHKYMIHLEKHNNVL